MTVASLKIVVGAEIAGATRALKQVQEAIKPMAGHFTRAGAALSLGLTAPIAAVGLAGLRASMNLEVLERTLTTLLGSAEDAGRVFSELRAYEFSSIFSGPELEQSARQLAAFGTEAERIVPTIDRLGNVAAGLNIPLTDIVDVYGRMQVSGRVTMRELTQLMQRGVPVVQEMAANLGVTEAEIQEMASKGQLNFGMIEAAFASMTSEGGMFFEMMKAQGNTLQGMIAFLRKDFEAFADVMGEVLMPIVRRLSEAARGAFARFQGLGEGTQKLIATVGLAAAAVGPLLLGLGSLAKVIPVLISGLKVAGALFAALTSPVALAVAGIAALVAIAYAAGADFSALKDALIDSFRTIVRATEPVRRAIKEGVGEAFAAVRALWQRHGAQIMAVVRLVFDGIIAHIALVMRLIGQAIGLALDLLSGNWSGAWERIKAITQMVAVHVLRAVDRLLEGVQALVSLLPGVGDKMAAGIERWRTRIAAAVEGLAPAAAEAAEEVGEAVGEAVGEGVASGLATALGGGGGGAPSGLENTLRTISAMLRERFITASDAARERADALRSALREAFSESAGRITAETQRLAAALREALRALAPEAIEIPEIEIPIRLTPPRDPEAWMKEWGVEWGPELDLGDAWKEEIDAILTWVEERAERVEQLAADISSSIHEAITDGVVGVFEGIGQMMAGTGSLADVGRSLLETFAGLMQKLGGLLVAYAMAGIKFQEAGGFWSFLLNPWNALAAGALLIAAGSAIRGLLSSASGSGAGHGGLAISSASVNPNIGSTAGTGTGGGLGSGGAGGGASGRPAPPLQVEIIPRALPSGDLVFATREGGRRLDTYGTEPF